MKMDVSFTDHSYIIGKGGHNIQQVMDNTGCHIHFPDSNRNSQLDKSNQVSIAGQPKGVESARNQIRELLPMVVSFELPLGLAIPSALDPSSMALQGILKSHGITVTFRPLHATLTLVVVKGSRRYADRLRQGLFVLVEYLTGGSQTQVGLVTLSTEIAPHHHSFVMGHGSCNVQQIARQTGCVITFPDPAAVANQSTSVLPPFLALNQQTCPQGLLPVGFPSKSTVQITGSFDAVYNAWLELMTVSRPINATSAALTPTGPSPMLQTEPVPYPSTLPTPPTTPPAQTVPYVRHAEATPRFHKVDVERAFGLIVPTKKTFGSFVDER
ncbi:hypothetical protein HPB50_016260 [Hyalomma asiaticum]|uniref:Uncharacterized protein n=1 Tax=Hyalomma asiaticum TaxID=266040 RepID=A0ACB7TJI1_HYAAI|nr:hypothetical protein HPB50_016260 [Hyalomma asiaticum]